MAQVPHDPFIVKENVILDNRRDTWFEENWQQWKYGLVALVVGFAWMMIRTHGHFDREPELPDRPLTVADVPLIQKKIKFLKEDAVDAASIYPHLKNETETQAAERASVEVYFTPDVFPTVEQLHRVRDSRLVEIKPELAGPLQARENYEKARYTIANNSSIADKAAAIAALEKQSDPAATGPEYSGMLKKIKPMVEDMVGDPDFDQAQQAFYNAFETAVLKRHPELAAFYHDLDNSEQAYHFFMAQANQLSEKMKELQDGSVSPDVPAPSAVPSPARRYGVKVGDTVEISSLNPVLAAHHAVITSMDDSQLTVRVGSDTFAVHWENVDRLKIENK